MTMKPMYEVVSPVGHPVSQHSPLASPLPNLRGRKIGLIWNKFRNGDLLLQSFAELLGKRFEGLEFIKLPSGKSLGWGALPDQSLEDIVKEARIDAAIVGVGG